MKYPQNFQVLLGKNGILWSDGEEPQLMSLEEAKMHVEEIVNFYTNLIGSGNNLYTYLYFDISYGITEYRGGHLMQNQWADGAYHIAQVDFKFFEKLKEIVAKNSELGIAMPRAMRKFSYEVIAGSFPVPLKPGPAKTNNLLRNYAIFESLVFLCEGNNLCEGNDLYAGNNLYLKTSERSKQVSASQIVLDVFAKTEWPAPMVAKPTLRSLVSVWHDADRAEMRDQISWFHRAKKHQIYNSWFRTFKIKMIETKITNYLCTCFYWRR